MHFAYTQNIKPTPEQQKKISEIFTPDYIIESSKPISIVKEQDSVIAVRDKQIKELKAKIEALKEEHKKTLVEIAKENKIAETSSQQIDSISDHQLKRERFKWSGLHLYIGAEVPEFNFESSILNAEFMYEFEKFEFGFKGELDPNVIQDSKYTFNYFLKVRYKLF